MRRGETTGSGSKYARWYQRHKDDPGFREKSNTKARARRAALPPALRPKAAKRSAEQRKRDTESMARSVERRRAFVDSLKTGPCTDCGKRYAPYVMDFDHRPGVHKEWSKSKFNTISYLAANAPMPRLLEEIKKCDLVCSNCHRERTHRRFCETYVAPEKPSDQYRAHLRRRELIDSLKRCPCADCGERYQPHIMDFDHRPGELKTGAVSTLQVSRVRLLAEIAKCDVVCSNCHRKRTYRRRKAQQAARRRLAA